MEYYGSSSIRKLAANASKKFEEILLGSQHTPDDTHTVWRLKLTLRIGLYVSPSSSTGSDGECQGNRTVKSPITCGGQEDCTCANPTHSDYHPPSFSQLEPSILPYLPWWSNRHLLRVLWRYFPPRWREGTNSATSLPADPCRRSRRRSLESKRCPRI